MLDREFIQKWKVVKANSAEKLGLVEPKNKMTYSFLGEAHLHHSLCCFLLGEEWKPSFRVAAENFRRRLELDPEPPHATKNECMHPLFLMGELTDEMIEPFTVYQKETMYFKSFHFHSFSLASYLLGKMENIKEHEEEILAAEEKKGGNHQVYKNWTKAILALSNRDEAVFTTYLEAILDEHKKMQRKGLKKSVLGEVSLPALTLLKLARAKGMNIVVDNPLAPEEFLDI